MAEPAESPDSNTQSTNEILHALSALRLESEPQHDLQPPPTGSVALSTELEQWPLNADDWKRFIYQAEESGDSEKIRSAFDALLRQYPTNPSAQIRYISHFLTSPVDAANLFKRFLSKSPDVRLWNSYLSYVRRINPTDDEVVRKAYEFAIKYIGQDKDSGDIWKDYLQLLRSSATLTRKQKNEAMRKAYYRAVLIPFEGVEQLWQELESFENVLDTNMANKVMVSLWPDHQQACINFRWLQNHMVRLCPKLAPPPLDRPELVLPTLPTFTQSDRVLVRKWKDYLKWEESGGAYVGRDGSGTLLRTRIRNAYSKALISMWYHPDIWFMAYMWLNSVGERDNALTLLNTGIEANPGSSLLSNAYTEALQAK